MTQGTGRGPDDGAPTGSIHPAGDSGQVEQLPDGSVSIPVLEEQLVCEKRLVVRERIIVRKETVTENRVVEADLRRQHVAVDPDADVAGRVTEGRPG
jgi:stress response protein YsnF